MTSPSIYCCIDCASLGEGCQVGETKQAPGCTWGLISQNCLLSTYLRLLQVIVGFMVEDHTFAYHFDGLEFLEHDSFTALCADAVGEVVKLFAVCK